MFFLTVSFTIQDFDIYKLKCVKHFRVFIKNNSSTQSKYNQFISVVVKFTKRVYRLIFVNCKPMYKKTFFSWIVSKVCGCVCLQMTCFIVSRTNTIVEHANFITQRHIMHCNQTQIVGSLKLQWWWTIHQNIHPFW